MPTLKPLPFSRWRRFWALCPTFFYHQQFDDYLPEESLQPPAPQVLESAWHQTNAATEATALELVLPAAPVGSGYSLVLSLALRYGKLAPTGAIEPLPKAVAARILAVA